jgi:mutator family transposase
MVTCYLLGVSITTLSKSQVAEMARERDSSAEEFRTRSLTAAAPFTFVPADTLVLKAREGGREPLRPHLRELLSPGHASPSLKPLRHEG